MRAIELAADADALKQRHLGHRAHPELEQAVGAARETRPLRFALDAALPLPDAQAHEQRGEDEREEREEG